MYLFKTLVPKPHNKPFMYIHVSMAGPLVKVLYCVRTVQLNDKYSYMCLIRQRLSGSLKRLQQYLTLLCYSINAIGWNAIIGTEMHGP